MDDRIDSPLDGAEASPATTTTTTTSSGDALAQRYPKRKRNEVKYADSDEDWVSTNSEESDFHPEVKVSWKMRSATYLKLTISRR